MSELIKTTITNGRKDSNVFGSGLDMNRGRITSITKINRGYIESGRTKVPPPIPPGKKGKLLTGRVIKNSIQQIFETELIKFAPLENRQRSIIDTLYG
jgi:hypothetical protein